jgi:hypothetical protein
MRTKKMVDHAASGMTWPQYLIMVEAAASSKVQTLVQIEAKKISIYIFYLLQYQEPFFKGEKKKRD